MEKNKFYCDMNEGYKLVESEKIKNEINHYNISLKEGYRYVWSEDTNFIVYQKNNGDIILGKINYEGPIKESEIVKLCEISYEVTIKDYDNLLKTSAKATLHHKIFLSNLFAIRDEIQTTCNIQMWLKNSYDIFRSIKKIKECKDTNGVMEFDIPVEILEKNNYISFAFWQIKEVRNFIWEIFTWLHLIDGKTLYSNNIFILDYFQEKEPLIIESPLEGKELYATAQRQNKDYETCIQNLEKFLEKMINSSVEDNDKEEAYKYSTIYKNIVGHYYPFIEKSKSLQLIKKQ